MTSRSAHARRVELRGVITILGTAALAWGCGSPSQRADAASALAYQAAEVLDQAGVSLGSVSFPVSCGEEAAEHMSRGLALLHHMTYTQAKASFEAATTADPECALGYWGVAMTYLHPLWPDVPNDEAFALAGGLLERARSVGTASPRESGYLTALEAYYADGLSRSEPERLAAFAKGWEDVASEYPDDPEAALFRALSRIATAPAEDKTFAQRAGAGEMAEAILQRIPDHPGAHHYVIHAYDVPPLADRALAAARNYGEVAPENAHALHMTSHIFTRVGDWEESIRYNQRSADAALGDPIAGQTSHHHLHALDYLAYAHLQRGEDAKARDVRAHLETLEGPVVDHAATAYAFAAVPARIALERQDWQEAAELSARWPSNVDWDKYPHLEAIPHFARALGAARTGDVAAARASVERLSALAAGAADVPTAYDWGIQVRIQAVAAEGWIAFEEDRREEALALLSEAADLEASTEKNPVTPGEALPARELLGDLLLELGRFAEAREAYEETLARSPNRFNSLYGAGRAAELGGDDVAAAEYYGKLVAMAGSAVQSLGRLDHARQYLRS